MADGMIAVLSLLPHLVLASSPCVLSIIIPSNWKKNIQVQQSNMIKVCNSFMEGIDRADENIDKYRTSIRGKKWHSSPLLSVSHWPYKMHGNFIKHMTRSQWIFWRLIRCHYVETQGHPADLCRTGRPQKRHIDSRYDGLSHVTVKQSVYSMSKECFAGYHTK